MKQGDLWKKGTKIEVNTGSNKINVNLRCPTDDVGYEITNGVDPNCGFKGVSGSLSGTCLTYCVQDRDDMERNFINNESRCIVSKSLGSYNTLGNQYSHGFEMKSIQKSKTYNQPPDPSVLTYPSFFTRLYSPEKIYQPREEFYTEKVSNSYFVSLTDSNTGFLDNIADWRRIFLHNLNTYSNPFQFYFTVYPENYIPYTDLGNLGKFGTSTFNAPVSDSVFLNISFETITSGINTQNYMNQAIGFYHGNVRRPLHGSSGSYFQSLGDSLNRIEYTSPQFSGDTAVSSTPMYSSIKEGFSGNPSPQSPCVYYFNIVQLEDSFYFSCRFYDSNYEVPWNYNPKLGDIFSPDFIFFNPFLYSYIFNAAEIGIPSSQSPQYEYPNYGTQGTSFLSSVFNKYILTNSSGNTSFNTPDSNKLQISKGTGYGFPKVSDYLLFMPTSYDSFSSSYPTLQIKRVQSIENSRDKLFHGIGGKRLRHTF